MHCAGMKHFDIVRQLRMLDTVIRAKNVHLYKKHWKMFIKRTK